MIRILLACIALLITAEAAAQEDSRWVRKLLRYERRCEWFDCYWRPVYSRPIYRAYGYPPGRDYTLTYTSPYRQGNCYPVRSVVGVEKYNLEEAKQNAIDLWMEQAKMHHGVRFMDPENAIILSDGGKGPDCYLSSTGTRASEKAAEIVGRRLTQCEFIARPCEPPRDPRRRF